MTSEPKPSRTPKWVPYQDSILVRYPHLAAEVDRERAAAMGLDFAHIAPGTRVLLPWRHPVADRKEHQWLQAGTSRTFMRAGCSICRGFVADEGTSLTARVPEVAKQWHPSRNGTRTAEKVTPGSRRTAWWLCDECSHVWPARISSRALDRNGCPRCAGQSAEPGDGSTLAVAHPELFGELDLDGVRHLGLDPHKLHARSSRKVPWVCRDEPRHQWSASPAARMNGCQCPACPPLGQSSAVERALLALMLQRCGDAVGNAPAGNVTWLDRRGRSLRARCDIVVPSLRLVVEYDGLRYHDAAERRRCDLSKTDALLAAGWRVVRVREATSRHQLADLDMTHDCLLQVQHRYGDRLVLVIDAILAWVDAVDS